MVIDFHTHVFPDKIAGKTIEELSKRCGLKPHTDGSLGGLIKSMKNSCVDYSVVLPIATKASQANSINTYASKITGKNGILSFGSIHPFSENWKRELDQISSMGLKGIKLHPDYQGFFVDDEKIFPVLKYAASLGLIVIFHSGVDIGLPSPVHCPPEKSRKMIDAIGGGKFVFAHTGGYNNWDDVEKYLVGQNIYFDISFTVGRLSDEKLISIIRNHGSERILFGTDSPWGGQFEEIRAIEKLGLERAALDNIMYKNAAKLLNIGC